MYLVRAAEVADAAQLRRFSCSGPKYTKWTKRVEKIIRANLADALLDPHRSIEALVAISDKDEMAGVVAMEPAADAPEIWMVHVLGVTEDHRRSGVGRTLLDEAFNLCRNRGGTSAVLDVHRSNQVAQSFFRTFEAVFSEHPTDSTYLTGSILLAPTP